MGLRGQTLRGSRYEGGQGTPPMRVGELFQFHDPPLVLHGGGRSPLKVECDALSSYDWIALAALVAERITFQRVEGVPRGGLPWAAELAQYAQPAGRVPLLIVDDVVTTGASMEAQRAGREAVGLVLFSRGYAYPRWITPLWQWNPIMQHLLETRDGSH